MLEAIAALFNNLFNSPMGMFSVFAFIGALIAAIVGWFMMPGEPS